MGKLEATGTGEAQPNKVDTSGSNRAYFLSMVISSPYKTNKHKNLQDLCRCDVLICLALKKQSVSFEIRRAISKFSDQCSQQRKERRHQDLTVRSRSP